MKVWVYLDGRQQGPFEDTELTNLPGFGENTKVWFEGLPKWQSAGELPQLRHIFEPQQIVPEEEAVEITVESCSRPTPDEVPPRKPVQELPPERPAFLNAGETFFAEQTVAAAGSPMPAEPCPPTYIGISIFLFLCCCSPVSFAALIGAICVTEYYNKGKLDKARKASEVTAWLVMASIALGMLPVMFMSAFFG